MDCIFCKICDEEIDAFKVDESDTAVAFLDAHPLSKGHTLVVPRNHVATILELDEFEIGDFFALVQKVTQKLQDSLHPDGFTIGINMHEAAGQAVEHLHVHIIPRWQGDGGGNVHSIVRNTPDESLEAVYRQLT